IEATVSFSEGSATFEIETDIQLQFEQLVANDDPVCEFVRRYGWSIKNLYLSWTLSDHLATILDESTQERGSRIVDLYVYSSVYTISSLTSGFDAMVRTIKRSQQLASLTYTIRDLGQGSMLKYTEFLIALGGWLTKLSLSGESIESWLPHLSQAIPGKSVFPVLQELIMHGYDISDIPRGCAQWIATMVAAPPQSLHNSPIPPPSRDGKLPAGTCQRGLRRIHLNHLSLQQEDWKVVINAIDLSTIELLSFSFTNFSQKELTLLVGRIAEYAPRTLLRSCYMFFQSTDLQEDDPGTLALYEKLQKLAFRAQSSSKSSSSQRTMIRRADSMLYDGRISSSALSMR
ncbi:hypothetical protein BGZ65_011388, partial [Modicella reniformis]